MADHFDAVPDPRHDITDFYVFQKPGDPAKSILIMDVNPMAPTLATSFDPQASYEFKIDINGDAEAEIAFHVIFPLSSDGQQTATVYRATGSVTQDAGPVGDMVMDRAPLSYDGETCIKTEGEYRFYAGLRSEPFFAEPQGFANNFQFTGQDGGLKNNVFSIVLEVPNNALGLNSSIGIWARTMAPHHGMLHQMDEMARPCNFFNVNEEDKHRFNGTFPAQQRALFLPKFVTIFQGFGYSEVQATQLAMEWLPNILSYDYTSAKGWPNGRQLADDIVDDVIILMTQGRVTTDMVEPHTNYLPDFPYLGHPYME